MTDKEIFVYREKIEKEFAQMRKHCKYGIAFLLSVAYWLGVLMVI